MRDRPGGWPPFEAFVAWRYLRASPGQSALTVGAVAVAVTVVIFINSLIDGLQVRLLRDNVGALPHLTLQLPRLDPLPLEAVAPPGPEGLAATRIEGLASRRRELDDPARVEEQLAAFPGIRAVSAVIRGQAFLARGSRRFGVTVQGADPRRHDRIVGLSGDLVAGRWPELGPEEVMLGAALADEAGVGLGDRVRLQSSEGVSATFRVAALFDTGTNAVDKGQVFLPLRDGQALFRVGRRVSHMMVKLEDPFQADALAATLEGALALEVDSWMTEQAMFVNGFRAQDQSRRMISGFSLLAASFGIASVLIVSVIRKSREIAILKSMGARDGQILGIFALQGLFVSLLGAAVGSLLGGGLLLGLSQVRQVVRYGRSDQLFPISFEPGIFLWACLSAVAATLAAALLPAARAARMDPVEAIRGE